MKRLFSLESTKILMAATWLTKTWYRKQIKKKYVKNKNIHDIQNILFEIVALMFTQFNYSKELPNFIENTF